VEWLDYPHLAKEVLSQWYAPRGTGKSVTAVKKAIAQA
jgi:hypothetical protein